MRNKLVLFLLVVIVYLVLNNFSFKSSSNFISPSSDSIGSLKMASSPGFSGVSSILPPQQDYAPTNNVNNRLVIQESSLSLLVKDVRETTDKIINLTKTNGGYMVNSNLSNPQDNPTETLTIRIPQNKLNSILDSLRKMSVKVVSENLIGNDVTDQYVDIDAKLATLNKTKAKFEDILEKAVNVQDILTVQREIINLQSQIDSQKGQQQYLEKNAELTKITIYLSTDELSLPFTPNQPWRPDVIFKNAVRSLFETLQGLGSLLIWTVVFSVVWIPLMIIVYIVKKRKKPTGIPLIN